MTSLTIFDPAMCCSTGICGAEIDQKLVDFAADLDWLKSQGVGIKRINLSQEPTLFAENVLVKSVLEKSGVEGLPVIIAGDALLSSGQYPARNELAAMAGFTASQTKTEATSITSEGCCAGSSEKSESKSSCC